jgi:ArsR family transcriptional regulator, arsenate/arsenite/antimonite-responsive transcriptional repressor / arsenate reductase (thioredoxin)
VAADSPPPVFLQLAGHPIRWLLLSALASSDRRVRELTVLVGQPQNAVSYHLARLRSAGLVSMRHSSADRRDRYYRIELARCAQLLHEAGMALHPAMYPAPAPSPAPPRSRRPSARAATPVRVLFLCTGNSGRSQIAEALLAQGGGKQVEACSAGSHPKPIHPAAVRVMRSYGIDLSAARSKPLTDFADARFDYVITLCDRLREVCPEFRGGPDAIHWSIPDPGAVSGARAITAAFRDTAADLRERIGFLTQRISFAA